jgi:RHS repeat-associated protein
MILNTINLDSCLISELTGLTTQTTNILLTDPLGSVIATFSTTAGSAALSGNQAYGPYGHLRYNAGGLSGMATSKGFSGQYSDAFSGLDYYNARYYQPAVGVFLSADSKEGNQQGMDPYMYVGGNPETYNDPTGEYYAPPPQGNGGPPPTCEQISTCWSGSGGSGHPPTGGNNPPPTRPTHQGVKLPGGCDAVCAAKAKAAILQYYEHQAEIGQELYTLEGDAASVGADILATVLDWATQNLLGVGLDLINLVAHLGTLIVDATNALGGNVPSWFLRVVGAVNQFVGVVDFARSVAGFLFGFSATLQGVFDLAKDQIRSFIASGISSLFLAGASFALGGAQDAQADLQDEEQQLQLKSNSQIYDECVKLDLSC